MPRFFCFVLLLLLVAVPAQANPELSFDDSEIILNYTGSNHTVQLPLMLRHLGANPAVAQDIAISSDGGSVLSSDAPAPLLIGGEIGMWYKPFGSTLMLEDPISRQLVDEVDLNAPDGYEICAILGLDYSETTLHYYATANIIEAGPDDCDDMYSNWDRWLITIDPFTGDITKVALMPFYVGSVVVLGDGQILVVAASSASNPGAVYQVSPSTGQLTLLLDPTNKSESAELVYRKDTNQLFYFNADDDLLNIFDISTWTETVVGFDSSDTRRVWGGIAYFENGIFWATDYGSGFGRYRRILATIEPDGPTDYEEIWQGDIAEPYTRGMVISSLQKGGGTCADEGNGFQCRLPTVAPWGGWMMPLELDIDGDSTGTFMVEAQAGGSSAGVTVKVIAPDLTISGTPNANQYQGGDTVTYTLTVVNQGDSMASSSQLTFNYPANLSFDSYTATQGSCTNGGSTVTCNMGSLNAGATVEFTISFTAGADGAVDATGSVSTDTAEAEVSNNTVKLRNVIGDATDLRTTVASDKPFVAAGGAVSVVVTTTNLSDVQATGVLTSVFVPDGWTVSALPTGCDPVDADNWSACTATSVAAKNSVTYTFDLKAPATPTLDVVVARSEPTSPVELDFSNNSQNVDIGVNPSSLSVALGGAMPSSGAKINASQSVLQLTLTNNGETDVPLAVYSLSVSPGTLKLPAGVESLSLVIFGDKNTNGSHDVNEPRLSRASLSQNANGELEIVFAEALNLSADKSMTIGIILNPASLQVATTLPSQTFMAVVLPMAPFALAALFGYRRRKRLLPFIGAAAIIVMGIGGCGETATELLSSRFNGTTVQLTVTGIDSRIAEGSAPPATIDGLPLEGPKVVIQ